MSFFVNFVIWYLVISFWSRLQFENLKMTIAPATGSSSAATIKDKRDVCEVKMHMYAQAQM